MTAYIRADDLIDYALSAVGGGYCWGAHGEVCSLAFREELARRAPDQAANLLGVCAKWDGKRVWDCSGLFRGAWRALWQYKSGGATGIWRTWCTGQKGTIDTMPDIPGIALFVQSKTVPSNMSHIGLYEGSGMAIDANGSRTGVLRRPITAHKWTHWALLDDVDYDNGLPKPEEIPALYQGYVKTRTGGGISIWTSSSKTVQVVKVPERAVVDVLGEPDGKGFAQVRYGRHTGKADLQYIIHDEGEEPEQEMYRARVTGVKLGLNLRTTPHNAVNTIMLLPPNVIVDVLPDGASGAYSYVRYLGKTGYATTAHLMRVRGEGDEG